MVDDDENFQRNRRWLPTEINWPLVYICGLFGLAAIVLAILLSASSDCAGRHGVLVQNYWGFPSCVQGAP